MRRFCSGVRKRRFCAGVRKRRFCVGVRKRAMQRSCVEPSHFVRAILKLCENFDTRTWHVGVR